MDYDAINEMILDNQECARVLVHFDRTASATRLIASPVSRWSRKNLIGGQLGNQVDL